MQELICPLLNHFYQSIRSESYRYLKILTVLNEIGSRLTCQKMHYLGFGIIVFSWCNQSFLPPPYSQLHVIILHSCCLSPSLFQAVSLIPFNTFLCRNSFLPSSSSITLCFSRFYVPSDIGIYQYACVLSTYYGTILLPPHLPTFFFLWLGILFVWEWVLCCVLFGLKKTKQKTNKQAKNTTTQTTTALGLTTKLMLSKSNSNKFQY